MKIKSSFFLLLLFCGIGMFNSCSGDDDANGEDPNAAVCTEFMADYEGVMTALTTYSNDPSEQNCENYKNALLDFYDDYEDCTLWTEDYQELVDEIQAINCSEAT